jgi:hypothetical protein
MIRPKKILSILLVIAFLAPWFTPLAHSFTATGNGAEHEAHYCEVSKGPCKHNEACPLKDQHQKNKHEGHGQDHASHTKTEKEKPDGKRYITSKCHTGEPASLSASIQLTRFMVVAGEILPQGFIKNQTNIHEEMILYKFAQPNQLERPPQSSLYHS